MDQLGNNNYLLSHNNKNLFQKERRNPVGLHKCLSIPSRLIAGIDLDRRYHNIRHYHNNTNIVLHSHLDNLPLLFVHRNLLIHSNFHLKCCILIGTHHPNNRIIFPNPRQLLNNNKSLLEVAGFGRMCIGNFRHLYNLFHSLDARHLKLHRDQMEHC